MDIEIVNGDLRPYFDKPITEMKDFLSHHWEDVSKASQQPFNYEILDRADLLYDTEPACRAVVVVRHMNREKELSFFKMIQKAFYFHNKDLRIIENYDSILEALDLDKEVFREGFNYEKYKGLNIQIGSMVKADKSRATKPDISICL